MTIAEPVEPETPIDEATEPLTATSEATEWWRSAVIYQVYPRSFADSDGDGIGDLPGITARLDALAHLGVDAVWLSPFYTSPQNDAGYDVADYVDVDPAFGTLADFDALIDKAHALGLRLIVDLVPNHSSSEHAWFKAALKAAPGSEERARYLFRDGLGSDGELPPNNWESVFGGPAWTRTESPDGTPGQWYLHLFDRSQPDFDWSNRWVQDQFLAILRFWLDRGVDGFRVDVAHGLVKVPGLPDYTPPPAGVAATGVDLEPGISSHPQSSEESVPYWAQEGVHEIFREWRSVLDQYEGNRVLVAEAWVEPLDKLAKWVRADEMNQAFNFTYLETPWSPAALRRTIDDSLSAFSSVGAPSTWVLSNHDVVRHATRLALTAPLPKGSGVGPLTPAQPIPGLGLRRARAATAIMLALPGSAYLYQGEELGLPEVVDLPDEARQDPTWHRTGTERYGRDGCRVPIPWEADAPAYGFNDSGQSWLPQPSEFRALSRDLQADVPESTLEFYRMALRLRRDRDLGNGSVEWLPGFSENVLAFRNSGVTVISNFGEVATELPIGQLLLSSDSVEEAALAPDATVWIVD